MEPISIFLISILAFLGSGCANDVADDVSASSYASVSGQSAQMGPKMDVNLPDKVYFEFDNFDLGDDAMDTLEQYIRFAKRAKAIRLEGHCDERGTREYNLALGEKRAQSVKEFLIVNGISSSKIDVVSYGEERPDRLGSSESAYKANRRVEISLY